MKVRDFDEYDVFDEGDLFDLFEIEGEYRLGVMEERKEYSFDSYQQALSFLKSKSEAAARVVESKMARGMLSVGIVVRANELNQEKETQNLISEKHLLPEVRRLIDKYQHYYHFEWFFESPQQPGIYKVYNFHTVETKNVFYVNKTMGEPTLVLEHAEKRSELDLLKKMFTFEPEVIAENLDYIQAEILMRGLMFDYTEKGEYILGATAAGYRKFKKGDIESGPYKGFDIRITENDFYKKFFPEVDQTNIKFDNDFSIEDLKQVALSINRQSLVRRQSMKVINFLESCKSKMSASATAKRIKALIINGPTDFLVYKSARDNGAKVIDIRELEARIESGELQKTTLNSAASTKLPKFDKELRETLRRVLNDERMTILELSKNPEIQVSRYHFGRSNLITISEVLKTREVWIADPREYIIKSSARMCFLGKKASIFEVNCYAQDWIRFGLFDETVTLFEKYADIENLSMSGKYLYYEAKTYRDAEKIK